jgi:hypothetical protein
MRNWLKTELDRQEVEKKERLAKEGKKPWFTILAGANVVNIDTEKGFRVENDSTFHADGKKYIWDLLQPLGYELQAPYTLHIRICKALEPFLQLDEAKQPPFVRMEINYDPSLPNKKRYGAKVL